MQLHRRRCGTRRPSGVGTPGDSPPIQISQGRTLGRRILQGGPYRIFALALERAECSRGRPLCTEGRAARPIGPPLEWVVSVDRRHRRNQVARPIKPRDRGWARHEASALLFEMYRQSGQTANSREAFFCFFLLVCRELWKCFTRVL